MKSFRTNAIVLRRVNYGEADRIIDFITPEGRMSGVARGVRKQKSKLAGGVELFAVNDVVFGTGKGELHIITSARSEIFYKNILLDYERMQFAYEMLAYVARFSGDVEREEWYVLAAEILECLDDNKIDFRLIKIRFFIRIADLMGESMNLTRDSNGHKLEADLAYRYDSSAKSLVIDAKGDIGAGHIKIMRLISVKPIKIVNQVAGMTGSLDECLFVARSHASLPKII